MIVTVWLTLGIAFGLMFSFSVFPAPAGGVSLVARAGAGAFSLSSVVQGVLSPVVGTFVDRFGPRA